MALLTDDQAALIQQCCGGPPPDPKAISPDDAHRRGYADGLAGAQQVCLDHVDQAGQAAYDQGYAQGVADRPRQRMLDRLRRDLAAPDERGVSQDLDEMGGLDMDALLDLMVALQGAGLLAALREDLDNSRKRAGAAALTIAKDWGDPWQDTVARLTDPDRKAVLARVPDGTYRGPAKPRGDADGDDDGPTAQTDDGSTLQSIATVTLYQGLSKDHKIGQFQVQAHVGPGGRLTNIENDLKVFEQKFKGSIRGIDFAVSVGVSLNSQIHFESDQLQRYTLSRIDAQVKGSLELEIKGVKFRLEPSAGSGGLSVVPVLEIPLPDFK